MSLASESVLPACVTVIDDDALVARAICSALQSLDVEVAHFTSAVEFAEQRERLNERTGCTLVDLRLAEDYGIDLIHSLADEGRASHRPNIVISGYADVTNTLEAMSLGCWTVLQKPIGFRLLRETVSDACAWSRANFVRCMQERRARELWESINSKERLTIEMILEGLPNKTVASRLGVSVRTVENRRRQIFTKLGIASVAQLGRIVAVIDSEDPRQKFVRFNRIAEYRIDAARSPLLDGPQIGLNNATVEHSS